MEPDYEKIDEITLGESVVTTVTQSYTRAAIEAKVAEYEEMIPREIVRMNAEAAPWIARLAQCDALEIISPE